MNILHIYDTSRPEGGRRIEVSVQLDNGSSVSYFTNFIADFTSQDRENIRWYLEDYLEYPFDPAPIIATRVEQRMTDLGEELFRCVFESSDSARGIWFALQGQLNQTRIEISTEAQDSTTIPWEIMREPMTARPVILQARSFVHTYLPTDQTVGNLNTHSPIRILLVICRPGGAGDAPFRSIANHLTKIFENRDDVQLDVLRPPTWLQFSNILRHAKSKGSPYHVVHFDGHGTFEAKRGSLSESHYQRKRGYLIFETESQSDSFISGPKLGKLLAETSVPILVLNACRSAYAEARVEPDQSIANDLSDAFTSLTQEVLNEGVPGVVSMRYKIYVSSAAHFVAGLYSALLQGMTLGESVAVGRRQLAEQETIGSIYPSYSITDWVVPIVYEPTPLTLFPSELHHSAQVNIMHQTDTKYSDDERSEIGTLPRSPDFGFFGRDETLLELERAFHNHSVVLLYAYAGSGKTATAVEFAHWYKQTGGVRGHVLWTSFEQPKPLLRILDQIPQMFGSSLTEDSIRWFAMNETERVNGALRLLEQTQILWIWDNVEQVGGFPTGMPSALTQEEQSQIVTFLKDAQERGTKFLLTSRRQKEDWLGQFCQPVSLLPMAMSDRVQMATAIVRQHGGTININTWRELLQFTQGNPLTIKLIVGQALRDNLNTREQISTYVKRLRAGEAVFFDDENEGRSKSLGASLIYGFAQAFSEEERECLAVLSMFQGFVNVQILWEMGSAEADYSLDELKRLSDDNILFMLGRAADIGMLSKLSDRYFAVHPVLPWFLKNLLEQYYINDTQRVFRAFVGAIGLQGDMLFRLHASGDHSVIAVLIAEEDNLLYALDLAKKFDWWQYSIGIMQGLNALYYNNGRILEWKRLVASMWLLFADKHTGGSLSEREAGWSMVASYLVRIAFDDGRYNDAERMQRVLLEVARQRAMSGLALSPAPRNSRQWNEVHDLGAAFDQLGLILAAKGNVEECLNAHREAVRIHHYNKDSYGEAVATYNLGSKYLENKGDLQNAKNWLRIAVSLAKQIKDRELQCRCYHQLGRIAYEYAFQGFHSPVMERRRPRYLKVALALFKAALQFFPSNSYFDMAMLHSGLGHIYSELRRYEDSLQYQREAIWYMEAMGKWMMAANARYNIALTLMKLGMFEEAREYAFFALKMFEKLDNQAIKYKEQVQCVIDDIDDYLQIEHFGIWKLPSVLIDDLDKMPKNEAIQLINSAISRALDKSSDRKKMMEAGLPIVELPKQEYRCNVNNRALRDLVTYCFQRTLIPNILITGSILLEINSRRTK